MIVLNWILDRAKEPSTYAGLSGLALALGLSDAEWSAIARLSQPCAPPSPS